MGLCQFFNYLNADEEGAYYGPFTKVGSALRTFERDPVIAQLAERCLSRYGIDLFQELDEGKHLSNGLAAKIIQFYLYMCLSRLAADRHPVPTRSVGFYSAGAVPAFLVAGVWPIDVFANDVLAPKTNSA